MSHRRDQLFGIDLFDQRLTTVVELLHDRGVVNALALLQTLEEIAQERVPLSLEALSTIFGVETIYHLTTYAGDFQRRRDPLKRVVSKKEGG